MKKRQKSEKPARPPGKLRARSGKAVKLLRFNAGTFWWFELLYKLLGVTVFVPLLYGAVDLTMMVTGYRYLTLENVWRFLRNPLTYVILFVILVVGGLYALVDMSAIIYVVHCSRCGQKTDVSDTIRFALRSTAGLFKKGRRGMGLLIYLMVPFFLVGQIPELLSSYSVPNMILITGKNGPTYILVVAIVFAFLCVPFSRFMFSFWYYTLEDDDTKGAMRKSRELGKGSHIYDLVHVGLAQVFLYLLYMLLLVVGIALAVFTGKLLSRWFLLSTVLFSIVKIMMVVLLILFTLLGTPVTCLMISMLFYQHKGRKNERESTMPEVHKQKNCRRSKRELALREKHMKAFMAAQTLLFVAAVGICIFYVYRVHRGEMNRNIEFIKTMEVTAHRGASRQYPENTMSAFYGAIEAGADWIELDIHQSSDGQIYVMHDDNFRRTTGYNAKAWDLSYDEIAKLDAGSFKGEDFAGERIPLLSEAIELAKEVGIRLNIELKPSVYEEGMEERLVDLLHETEFVDRCVVTSQQYNSISRIKQLDETITTVYVTGFAYGNVNRLIYADHFSVKSTSITPGLVRRVHNAGKQIYAWTVNSRDSINLMIDREVDNIITDNVALAKRCIAQEMASDTVNNLIQFLNRKIRLGSFRFGG